MIFFKNAPEHYPSPAARLMGTHKFSIKEDFIKMAKDKNFMIFTVVFSVMFAVYACLGGTIDFLMANKGYHIVDTSIVGGGFIVAGVFGSGIIGVILDKYRKGYLLTLRILVFCCLVVCIPFYWTLPTGKWYILAPNAALFGLFALPLIPVGTLFCVEISFPINESMSLGWILMWA